MHGGSGTKNATLSKRIIAVFQNYGLWIGILFAFELFISLIGQRTGLYLSLAFLQMAQVVLTLYLLTLVMDFGTMSNLDTSYYANQVTQFFALEWVFSVCVLALDLGLTATTSPRAFGSWIEIGVLCLLAGWVIYDTIQHTKKKDAATGAALTNYRVIDPTTVWKTQPQFQKLVLIKVVFSAVFFSLVLIQMGFHLSKDSKVTSQARSAVEELPENWKDIHW